MHELLRYGLWYGLARYEEGIVAESKNVLIVVHGMGEQKRTSSTVGVANSMVEVVKRRGDPDWHPDLHASLGEEGRPYAEFEFSDQTWTFTEYWWAREFAPPKVKNVAGWIGRRLKAHFGSILQALRHAFSDIGKKDAQGNADPRIARLHHAVAAPIYIFLTLVMFLATFALVLLLQVLELVNKVPGIPTVFKSVQSVLRMVAVDLLGDIYVYLKDQSQASHIRSGLEEILVEYGDDPEVGRVVLLAHSTGNMVVLDSLAHMNTAGAHRTKNQDALNKVKAIVGIGSILPMAWNDSIIKPGEDDRFIKDVPDHIHWYHLWTRYDVGPAGPLGDGPHPPIDPDNLCDRRVSNAEDLSKDHTGYWSNHDQVHTLVLEEMGGLDDSNPFWRGATRDPDYSQRTQWIGRSDQTQADFTLRRKHIAEEAFARLLTYLTLPFSFVYLLILEGRSRQMAEWIQLDWVGRKLKWDWLADSADEVSGWAEVGVAGIVAVIVFVVVYLIAFRIVFKRLWWNGRFARQRMKRDENFRDWRTAGRPDDWIIAP